MHTTGTVIVLSSFITDLVARAPRLPQAGESLIGDEFGTYLGGKGFNQAVAASRMGAEVILIGRVGNDTFGDNFFAAFQDEGLQSQFVERDPAVGTGTACVMVGSDSGQNAIIVLPRANHAVTVQQVEAAMQSILIACPPDRVNYSIGAMNCAATLSCEPEKAVFMAQCEMLIATIVAGLQLAHASGMTTIFNLAPIPREPLPDDIFSLVDILVVNESEAEALSGVPVSSPTSAQQAAERLLAKGVRHVIVTLGAQGSVWSTNNANEPSGTVGLSHQWIPTFPVKQVDATAAGDAFCGALAASLARGAEMLPALRLASAAGALAATKMGAFPSLPKRIEVEALATFV